MKMLFAAQAGILAVALTATSAHATSALIEDFSGGPNGWSVNTPTGPAQTGGIVIPGGAVLEANGGPAGAGDAYVSVTDPNTRWTHLVFGNGWSGDLSAFDGGTFSIDYRQFAPAPVSPTSGNYFTSFGSLLVIGAAGTATADAIGTNPRDSWDSASIDFDSATFGVSQATWDAILGNVSEIRIQAESWSGVTETVGFDNVTLAPVPLPAGGLLLLTGLGALALRRARKS